MSDPYYEQCRICRCPAAVGVVTPFGTADLCDGHADAVADEKVWDALKVSFRHGPDDRCLDAEDMSDVSGGR